MIIVLYIFKVLKNGQMLHKTLSTKSTKLKVINHNYNASPYFIIVHVLIHNYEVTTNNYIT